MDVRFSLSPYGSLDDAGDGDIVTTPDPVRSLYNGDLGSSILQKFAYWYQNRYFCDLSRLNDSYYCVRSQNGTYKFYVGDISRSGAITDCDVVTYEQVQVGGYNSAWQWSVSHATSGSVDLDGYSGYIYSSYPDYQANPYMVQVKTDTILTLSCCACVVMLVGMSLFRIIKGWFNGKHQSENNN